MWIRTTLTKARNSFRSILQNEPRHPRMADKCTVLELHEEKWENPLFDQVSVTVMPAEPACQVVPL